MQEFLLCTQAPPGTRARIRATGGCQRELCQTIWTLASSPSHCAIRIPDDRRMHMHNVDGRNMVAWHAGCVADTPAALAFTKKASPHLDPATGAAQTHIPCANRAADGSETMTFAGPIASHAGRRCTGFRC